MSGNEPLGRIMEEVEYLLARRRVRAQERPRLVVVHEQRQPSAECSPGEIIDRCYLQYPDREIPIPLALPGLMLCDCMVRYNNTPLSVARMERILAHSAFYRRLGANSFERNERTPHFTRVALRVYLSRLGSQIAKALKKGGSALRKEQVLISETTESNVAVHYLNLPVHILHRMTRAV
jgi:hypothetical protein